MKGIFLYILVSFFLFEVSLPLCLDLYPEINIEHNETEKDTESEKEIEKQEDKRRQNTSSFFVVYVKSLEISDQTTIDSFKILENEFFDLYDPPPEC